MSTTKLTETEQLISDIRYILYKTKDNNASKLETINTIEQTLNAYTLSNKIKKL
tara:strand:- start:418 stop:579 length:162 start_codon:yes stop_codon:yes gene_type:complete